MNINLLESLGFVNCLKCQFMHKYVPVVGRTGTWKVSNDERQKTSLFLVFN